MSSTAKRRFLTYVGWGGLLGALPGALYAATLCGPEMVKRMLWAAGGGMGERACWGEPLHYIVLFLLFYALPGAGLGAILGALIGWMRRK